MKTAKTIVPANDATVQGFTLGQYICMYTALSRVHRSYTARCEHGYESIDFKRVHALVNACIVSQLGNGLLGSSYTQVSEGFIRALWDQIPVIDNMRGDTDRLANAYEDELRVWG